MVFFLFNTNDKDGAFMGISISKSWAACPGYGGDMLVCHKDDGGDDDYEEEEEEDEDETDPWSEFEKEVERLEEMERRRAKAQCIMNSNNDKSHCTALATSTAIMTAGLCAGFTLPPAQAACAAVAAVGGIIGTYECDTIYNNAIYQCDLMP